MTDAIPEKQNTTSAGAIDFEAAVDQFYQNLYRFAHNLTRNPTDAADLTQETFQTLIVRGDQIREPGKLRSWLFTTLYRRFLHTRRRKMSFPEINIEVVENELPSIEPKSVNRLDAEIVVNALESLAEIYRAPVSLFYLESLSYKEIADVLSIPIGTVMSRLSRGKNILRASVSEKLTGEQAAEKDVAGAAASTGPRRKSRRKHQQFPVWPLAGATLAA